MLPDGLFSQTGRQTSRPKLPEDGIIVRWAGREPMKIYAGHINWTVVIRTGMYKAFRVTGKPGPNTIIVRDAKGQMVPPSPVQPVYTLKSGNVHSHFVNAHFHAFTLSGLGFYLAPGRHSIEVIHRNNQDPPKEGSTHSAVPFKGELKSPRFYFEVLPHPKLDWGKPVMDIELTISSKASKMAVGGSIELQATIQNTGKESRTLPDTSWEIIARAFFDDPKGERFMEQKRVDRMGLHWTRKPKVMGPGETHSFSYSTECFSFGNKPIGWKGDEIGLYLAIPGPKMENGKTTPICSNKIPIRVYRPIPIWIWGSGLAVVLLAFGIWGIFRLRRKRKMKGTQPLEGRRDK